MTKQLVQIRDDLRDVEQDVRNYRNFLPPSAVGQAGKRCVDEAIASICAACARLNEAIGWESERTR